MVQIRESTAAIVSSQGEFWDRPMEAMPDEIRHIYDAEMVEAKEMADKFSTAKK